MNIFVFFTWDISLSIWYEKGLLAREIKYYEALVEQGYKITFLTWGGKEDRVLEKHLPAGISIIPAYEYLPQPPLKALRLIISPFSVWIARQNLNSCNTIKTNQMWGGWCAAFAKIIFKKPLLVRTGFELYKFSYAQKHGILRRIFIFAISKFTYNYADLVYVATPNDKEFIKNKFSVPTEKIKVRPNWIDESKFSLPSTLRKKNSLLFVGRLTTQKNIPLIFDAIENSSYTLDIIGEGELKDSLIELASEKNIKVNFLGSIPNDKLPSFYKKCTAFILSSLFEGNPKTLLEAMSCGCAVIGTNVDGINNIIHNEKNGLLSEPLPEDLRSCIDRITSDTSLQERLGKNARQQIEKTQTLDILIQKEIKDYRNNLKQKK